MAGAAAGLLRIFCPRQAGYILWVPRSAFLACLVLFLLAGCESGASTADTDSDAADVSESTNADAAVDGRLRKAVEAYSDAYLAGDADAGYALLSQRCQHRIGKAEFAAMTAMAADVYGGTALPMTSYTAHRSGDLARVTYTYATSDLDQESEPWVREHGQWRQDDC